MRDRCCAPSALPQAACMCVRGPTGESGSAGQIASMRRPARSVAEGRLPCMPGPLRKRSCRLEPPARAGALRRMVIGPSRRYPDAGPVIHSLNLTGGLTPVSQGW